MKKLVTLYLFYISMLITAAHGEALSNTSSTKDITTHLLFHAPLDGELSPAVFRGYDKPVVSGKVKYDKGLHGQGVRIEKGNSGVGWWSYGNIQGEEGSISFWIKPDWANWDRKRHFILTQKKGALNFYAEGLKAHPIYTLMYMTGSHIIDNKWRWNYGKQFKWRKPANAASSAWYHFVITWKQYSNSQSEKSFYYNGKLAWTATIPANMQGISVQNKTFIGTSAPGVYDEITFWDKALSAENVYNLFNGKYDKAIDKRAEIQKPLESELEPTILIDRGCVDHADFIYFDMEPVTVKTMMRRKKGVGGKTRVSLNVVNIYGKSIHREMRDIEIPSGAKHHERWTFIPSERGIFKVVLTCETDGIKDRRELVTFGVVSRRPYDSGIDKNSPFGGHTWLKDPFISLARKLGVKSLRNHDFTQLTWWNRVEPEKGTFIWKDELIKKLKANNINLMGEFLWVPAWAGTRKTGPPDNWDDFRNYVSKTVNHYKGFIKCWEVWNEPHYAGYWGGTPEEYAHLLKIAYEAAKKADPDCCIVGMGGVSLFYPDWVERVFKAGGLQYMDIMSFHGYYLKEKPVAIKDYQTVLARTKELMKKYGRVVPLWATEGGVAGTSFYTDLDFPELPPKTIRPQQNCREAAGRLIKLYATYLSNGVERWFYYCMTTPPLVRSFGPDGISLEFNNAPKPHLMAYAGLTDRLLGRTFFQSIQDNHYVRCHLFRGAKGDTAILFGRFLKGRTLHISIPCQQANLQFYNMMNNRIRFPYKDGAYLVPLTEEPIFIDYMGGQQESDKFVSILKQMRVSGHEGLKEDWLKER